MTPPQKPGSRFAQVHSPEELQELQRAFARVIRRPLDDSDKMAPDEDAEAIAVPSPSLTPHERLELYAQQYWWRIEASFDEDFPRLRALLGEELYLGLRDRYLLAHPSTSFTLRNLGSDLPQFIHNSREKLGALTDVAYDCARMEWAIIEAFDATEVAPLQPVNLTDPNFATRPLFLQPHLQLLSCSYPVNQLLSGGTARELAVLSNTLLNKAANSDTQHVNTAAANIKLGIRLAREATHLVVHRREFLIYVKPVSAVEYQLLVLLREGQSLDSLAAEAAELLQNHDEIQSLFCEWNSLQWLSLGQTSSY